MINNPFNPSFGTVPSVFLDRNSLSQRVITELNNGNSPFQTSLIYGQRGAGKTTLMTDVANELSKSSNWQVVNLVLDDDLLDSLIAQLREKLVTLKLFSEVDLKIEFKGIQFNTSMGNDNKDANFQTIFHRLLQKFTQKGINILITIDEVKATPLLRKLVSCYQIMLRDNLNVSLLMAGLPENVSEIQNDDVLTFLLRANRITLNPLDVESIKNSYAHIFKEAGYQLDIPTVIYMTKQTKGFAYAFQLLGYWVWKSAGEQGSNIITKETIDRVLDQYISDLFRNVYYKVYHEMTEKERQFVQAMVKIGRPKVKAQEIGREMDKKPGYISVYRRKLIDDQIIMPASYGYVQFMLPYFDRFVEEQIMLDEF
ncbi:ATP-binding protein [Lactobacillus sp. Marseille-P7033]|nr:ATP-binding protein [Lactobacillus sp. Marseille-P7033]NGC78370.1 ATP-binding protein [Limosilactobacillus reuteri]